VGTRRALSICVDVLEIVGAGVGQGERAPSAFEHRATPSCLLNSFMGGFTADWSERIFPRRSALKLGTWRDHLKGLSKSWSEVLSA